MPPRGLDEFSNSRLALSLAAGVGRATPPAVGRRLATRAAALLSLRRNTELVAAVRSNQWVVSGGTLTGRQLDDAVRENLEHIARCVYDYYHLADDADALLERVTLSDEVTGWVERVRRGEALVFAALHLSNFDLGGRALARHGFRAQLLGVPDPTDAYRVQNELRREVGLDVTPISMQSLRTAQKRLEGGGAVLTGIDRPVPGSSRTYRFFGRQAHLPSVHVRLASRAQVPLVLAWAVMDEDGRYDVRCAEVPLSGKRGTEAERSDTEAVLARAAEEVAKRPTQWAMPHAVWPEAIGEIDALEGGSD